MNRRWSTWQQVMAATRPGDLLFWPRRRQALLLLTITGVFVAVVWATAPVSLLTSHLTSLPHVNAFRQPETLHTARTWHELAVMKPVVKQLSHWSSRKTPADTVLQFSGAPEIVRALVQRLAAVGVISSFEFTSRSPELRVELHMMDAWLPWTSRQARLFDQPLAYTRVASVDEQSVQISSKLAPHMRAEQASFPGIAPAVTRGVRVVATVSGSSGGYALIQTPSGLSRVRTGDSLGSESLVIQSIAHQEVRLANGQRLPWR